jgi:hypothetical protein
MARKFNCPVLRPRRPPVRSLNPSLAPPQLPARDAARGAANLRHHHDTDSLALALVA